MMAATPMIRPTTASPFPKSDISSQETLSGSPYTCRTTISSPADWPASYGVSAASCPHMVSISPPVRDRGVAGTAIATPPAAGRRSSRS